VGEAPPGQGQGIDARAFEKMRPENVPTLLANIFRFKDLDFLQNHALQLLDR
jgi:hypothetical protein